MKLTITPTGGTVNAEHEGINFPLSVWKGFDETGMAVTVAVGYFQIEATATAAYKANLSRFKEQTGREVFDKLERRNLQKP
jgi:hypothetical protein